MDESGTSPPEALPKWLTEEYFRSLFRRKSPGEEVTVQNVIVKFADEERIHGKLIRVAVDVATQNGAKTLSFVVKRPGPGQFSSTPASANMYRMESLVLGEIIPAMEKVLDAVAPGKFGQLAPRLVDYGLDENRFIMTEDLSVQDFSTGNRQIGLDLEHSLAYAKHIAAFHAASVAVMDRYESEIKAIPLLIDSEEVKFLNEFIATSMKGVLSVLDSWEEGSKYADQVRNLGASLPSRLAQANRAQPDGLNVLCHGDMFVNNILFRRGGGADAVRLVDFELSRVGSFADDLVGFLVSAVNDDVLHRHWERVTEQYREALNAALFALGHGSRALSQEAVREALRAQRAVAQFALFHMLPHTRAPAAVDLRAGGSAFAAPAYHALLRLLLPRFRALGWLDEYHRTSANQKIQIPSWLNRNYFQFILQQQSTGADLQVLRVHVTKPEGEPTSTTDVFQVAVEISFPSGVVTKLFRVKCPGNAVFYKMSTRSCMLQMETLALGKLHPVTEEILQGAVSRKVHSQAPSPLDRKKIFRSNIRRKSELKPIHHKTSDLKFCLAVIRHLALFHVASMIALDQNNSRISGIPIGDSSRILIEYIKTSLKSIISPLDTLQNEKTEKVKRPSEAPNERAHLDTQETILKYDTIYADTQNTIVMQNCENKQISCSDVSNEPIQIGSYKTCLNYRVHEDEEPREQENCKFNNKFNPNIACANYTNKLCYPAESINIRENITELSEDCFETFNSRFRGLSHNTKERSEDLQSRFGAHYSVNQVSFVRVSPQASLPEEVNSCSRRKHLSVHLLELPQLTHCGLTERILPLFNTCNFVHIYT